MSAFEFPPRPAGLVARYMAPSWDILGPIEAATDPSLAGGWGTIYSNLPVHRPFWRQPMQPSIGRIVIHRGIFSNGQMEHPAIITRVWSDACVNLTVFPDYGALTSLGSEMLIDPQGSPDARGWFWPPRVGE